MRRVRDNGNEEGREDSVIEEGIKRQGKKIEENSLGDIREKRETKNKRRKRQEERRKDKQTSIERWKARRRYKEKDERTRRRDREKEEKKIRTCKWGIKNGEIKKLRLERISEESQRLENRRHEIKKCQTEREIKRQKKGKKQQRVRDREGEKDEI